MCARASFGRAVSKSRETLPPEIYLHVHDEILADGAKRGLLHHFPANGRLAVAPLSFVLADARTLAPVLVIELDDKSHWQTDARQRDAFKDAALESAGVRVLRVKVGRYDVGELRAAIRGAIL